MDKAIKTRSVVKDIKVLDRRQDGLAAVRTAHSNTREVAEKGGKEGGSYNSGADYATDKSESAAKGGAIAASRKAGEKTKDAKRLSMSTAIRIVRC